MLIYLKMYEVRSRKNKLAGRWRREQGEKNVAGVKRSFYGLSKSAFGYKH